MGDNYLGEIRIFAGNYPPAGWAFCNGQLVSVQQYQALFALLSTTYGGDGRNTFGLPNLQGLVVMHTPAGAKPGNTGGSETVTIQSIAQIPNHNHVPNASTTNGEAASPQNNHWASSAPRRAFTQSLIQPVPMAPAIQSAGTDTPLPHENRMPYLAMSYIIALEGNWPPKP